MEIWKPVVGAEGHYEVSDLGRVRSVDRYVTMRSRHGGQFTRLFKGVLRKPSLDKDGYLRVGLYLGPEMTYAPVHRMVAKAFLPNPHNFPEVDHQDNDRANARLGNLQWVAYGRNTALMVERGRSVKGEQHQNARLTESAVKAIRRRARAGESFMALAADFGVSDVAVRCAVLRVTWRHVV